MIIMATKLMRWINNRHGSNENEEENDGNTEDKNNTKNDDEDPKEAKHNKEPHD